MIPTALGNMVGGGLFVGTAYWYLYLTGEVGVGIDFNIGGLGTAMEAGGPMRSGSGKDHKRHSEGTLIGRDPNGDQKVGHEDLPHSGGQMMSSLGRELSDTSPYAKTHAERMKSDSEDEKV